VFDLTNSASFEHLPQWIEEVRANVKSEIPLLLVGNKSDLIDQRSISMEEINKFTQDFNLYYMETSAKTGDGVGDCFYILACLMIGQGVPDQLIANRTVFSPGQIIVGDSSITTSTTSDFEAKVEYEAPPVPEPGESQHLQSEPEEDYVAPPVPEPVHVFEEKSEIEYEAPPVPEPSPTDSGGTIPSLDAKTPEIEIPEPTDIEFRTPDEILSEKPKEKQPSVPIFENLNAEQESFVPKSAPFTSNIPTPVPPPKEFQTQESEAPNATPFRVIKQEEPPKPQPSAMTFQSTPEPQSDSLVDYMPQTILSKKEKKRIAKEKKKEEKERAKLEKEKKRQVEREKQEKLLLDMKKSKKSQDESKKGVPPTQEPVSSLFQTLTQRTDDIDTIEKSDVFVPFISAEKKEDKKVSTLRIIPNVADIESESTGFTALTPPESEVQKTQSKDLLICEQCGAILSADYAFCNKCGNKLN
jgi:hypothetical protein